MLKVRKAIYDEKVDEANKLCIDTCTVCYFKCVLCILLLKCVLYTLLDIF